MSTLTSSSSMLKLCGAAPRFGKRIVTSVSEGTSISVGVKKMS
jgi:hypothetical protein